MANELSLKDAAELYRLGVLSGYFTVADAVQWADNVITSEVELDLAIIKVSLASRKRPEDVACLLADVRGEADSAARKVDLLGLYYRKLTSSPDYAQSISRV